MIVTPILSVQLYQRWGKHVVDGRFPRIFWTLMTLFITVIMIPLIFFTANSVSLRSRVDVSPLANLTTEQVARVEDIFAQFEDFDFIEEFHIREVPNHTGNFHLYSFSWRSGEASMHATVSVRRSESHAINDMESTRRRGGFRDIVNDNNTEAVLRHARSATSVPSGRRWIQSRIRMGNVVINLNEVGMWYEMRNNISSEFIVLVYELLQED
jgi:hypothetical protein